MGEAGQRGRLFGTDGVRGVAGHDLTASLAMDLSVAAAAVLLGSGPPTAVVGRDPRASGEFLEAAVVAGLAGAGIHVLRLGVIPTPGVAYLTRALGAAFGVVIDAGAEQERYLDYLLSTLPGPRALAGLRVVADCAHGAAYRIAPQALRRAGAEVIAIGAEPDGLNINAGYGSTCLGTLAAAVVEHGADAGVAYDGDADRCLAVDADGQLLDGDHILAVLATELKESGRLARDAVVVTVMSNQGFHVAMREAGIEVIETPVGDKYVFAAMRDGGYVLGGEQSGHIILLEHATTGDGILTSLQLLAAVHRHGMPLAAAAKMMRKYPQVLVNVPGDASQLGPEITEAVTRAEETLGDNGRVLVRPSGTEPAIRLMVQAADAVLAEQVIGQLAAEVRLALAGQ